MNAANDMEYLIASIMRDLALAGVILWIALLSFFLGSMAFDVINKLRRHK